MTRVNRQLLGNECCPLQFEITGRLAQCSIAGSRELPDLAAQFFVLFAYGIVTGLL